MQTNEDLALIFDIQGFSVHDGPGGRSLVFFKGCPLHCSWCSNPEGISPRREVMFRSDSCIRCTDCITACPSAAVTQHAPNTLPLFDRSLCKACDTLSCVDHCWHSALGVAGRFISQQELMRKIERDRRFWGSGGGVTLGGGEMMGQYKFAARFLEACQKSYIHTAIETCGYASWTHYQAVLPHTDWIFVDLKHMDDRCHRAATGVSNRLILNNIQRMASEFSHYRLMPRIPIIPGVNDSQSNIDASAQFLLSCGLHEVNLLPFHRLGDSKYTQLGCHWSWADTPSLIEEALEQIQLRFIRHGITCYCGSDTPF
ncbi:MAG TPA: glycyl-radical enzyme activating protein [Scandinavium sp.]|jgi:glycyl-radical enzyme activating protein